MTSSAGLKHLDRKLEHLQAIIDGSEAQTREATTVVIGLLVAFLKKKGLLDYDELATFLAEAAGPDSEAEDHNGRLTLQLRRVVTFHKGLEDGTAPTYVPLSERMSATEIAEIRALARAAADAERASACTAPSR